VADQIAPTEAVIVHTSGATTLEALSSHHNRASVHPLAALPDRRVGAERLTDAGVFAVAGHQVASHIVALLGGTAIQVDDDQRALYHATAAVASNHLVALCHQVERLAERCGVPAEAYWQLMAGSLDNVKASGATQALTGPAARGDRATIAAHLAAIGPDERSLYLALSAEAATMAGHVTDPRRWPDDEPQPPSPDSTP
jgi:predicted short-subunit dehydrogenase-like oxidoreductase (DUF2520 family)